MKDFIKHVQRVSKLVVLIGTGMLLIACQKMPVMMLSLQAEHYFHHPSAKGENFEDLGNGLYAFQYELDRSLIVNTNDGLIVIDPFDVQMAERLISILSQRFPNKTVTHLIYSHQHLDHTRGGKVYNPETVIANENTRWHYEHYADEDTLKPTRYIRGIQEIVIGGRTIHLIDFEHGHAGHLYGFYFPEDRLLYAPDLALCNSFFPFGYPDFNYAGQMEMLEKARALEFDRFISSHFANGDKSCIEGTMALFKDTRKAVLDSFDRYGLPIDADAKWFRHVVGDTQTVLKEKYSDWHGYKEMSLPFILRQISGAYLGF